MPSILGREEHSGGTEGTPVESAQFPLINAISISARPEYLVVVDAFPMSSECDYGAGGRGLADNSDLEPADSRNA